MHLKTFDRLAYLEKTFNQASLVAGLAAIRGGADRFLND